MSKEQVPSTLYGKYILERENKHIIEEEYGFATYSFHTDYVYIEDIFVLKEHRSFKNASEMAKKIEKIAKSKGYNKIIGSVCTNANNSTISLKVLLAYGFNMLSCSENMIYFTKEIE